MNRMAPKYDVVGVGVGEDLDQVDGAWERSCVAGTQRRGAKDVK
jgi:hypothetical protein